MLSISPPRAGARVRIGGSHDDLKLMGDVLTSLAKSAGRQGAPLDVLAGILRSAACGNHRMFMIPSLPGGTLYEVDIAASDVSRALPLIKEHMFTGVRKGMQSIHALTFLVQAGRALGQAQGPAHLRFTRAAC